MKGSNLEPSCLLKLKVKFVLNEDAVDLVLLYEFVLEPLGPVEISGGVWTSSTELCLVVVVNLETVLQRLALSDRGLDGLTPQTSLHLVLADVRLK